MSTTIAAFTLGFFAGWIGQHYRHRYLMEIIHGHYHLDRLGWNSERSRLSALAGSQAAEYRNAPDPLDFAD